MEFVGRGRELKTLEAFFNQSTAGLLILYGRRRIGKTRLISTFLEQQPTPNFYWMATTHNETYQLRDFSQAVLRYDPRLKGPPTPDFSFAGWEQALNHLTDIVALDSTPHLLVLDEFSYLLRNEPAISSVFQKLWDHRFSHLPQLKLILTGSLIGMMSREVFSLSVPALWTGNGPNSAARPALRSRLRPLSGKECR